MTRPAHILLVDDNRMDVELTLDAFREARLANTIHVAPNGQAALDYLFGRDPFSDRAAHPLPDLILLDLKMPGVDGFEVLRQIKTAPVLKRLPIVVLTSSREEGDRILSYDHGANSYLVKPVAFDGFLDVVGRIEQYWLTLNVGPPREAESAEPPRRAARHSQEAESAEPPRRAARHSQEAESAEPPRRAARHSQGEDRP